MVMFLSLKMTEYCMKSYGFYRQKNILGVILITERLVKYFTIDEQLDKMDKTGLKMHRSKTKGGKFYGKIS